ncbi:MAG: DUF5671 domain-containing protein [Acidimicrobiia bacterium]|nr:DUF5671 domain-containing protein [Acidimicrobiia bacterium]MDH5505240.1 DUF5671 domain-containing protein [Acidimicrobiia bacterium]
MRLVFLLVAAAVGVGLFFALKRPSVEGTTEQVGSTIRRLFQYALLFGAVILVAIGLSSVLGQALSFNAIAGDRSSLALPLAYLAVGLPAGLWLAAWVRRQHARQPLEAQSVAWTLYLTLASLTSLITLVVAALRVFEGALGAESYSGDALARMIVWFGVWYGHWVLATRAPRQQSLVWHRLAGSATGLVIGAVGLGNTIASGLRQLFDQMSGGLAATNYSWTWRNAVAWLVVGGLVWGWYWLFHTLGKDLTSRPFQGYVVIVGVLSGLITALVAISGLLYDVLVWFLGDAESSGWKQFESVPGGVAALVTGLWVWWYHRAVLAPVRSQGRLEVDRVYDYLVAAAGLVTSATGATILLVAFFDTFSRQGEVAGSASGINLVLAAVTAFLVGLPVWGVVWRRTQRLAAASSEETNAVSRRAYLFLLMGVGGTTALISLISVFFSVFQSLLGETSNLLRDIRIPLALVITVGSLSVYHWLVFRKDRLTFPPEPSGIRSIMLVGATEDVGKAVARQTGAKVQTLQRSDDAVALEFDDIIGVLNGHASERVLVVGTSAGTQVVPLRS